jgi:hypothetical protein
MNANSKRKKLAASRLRSIAVESLTDPRTVEKYVAGDPVAPLCAARIERALARAGLQELIASTYAKRRTSPSSPPHGTPPAAA